MHLFKKRRREELRRGDFPAEWSQVLAALPYVQALPPADRQELEGHIKIFLAEKPIVGVQGFEVNDAVRVTIAAQACLLLLHRDTDYYPLVEQIVVYPTAFVSSIKESALGTVLESQVARVGESDAKTGTVVLAWDRLWEDARALGQGKDLVIHEFAHQLDAEDGSVDGAPRLDSRAGYRAWAEVLGREYTELDQAIAQHRALWIDPYADTNPAEFFAVVTEMFFKAPHQMRAHSAELYEQFVGFFKQDPAGLFPR